jgi:hypothetical protein
MVESTAQQFECTASNSNLYNEKPADEDSIAKIELSAFESEPDT